MTKDSVLAKLSDLMWGFRIYISLKIGPLEPQKLGPFFSIFLMRKATFQWLLRPYFPLIRGMFPLRSGLRFLFRSLDVPEPRVRKRPLSLSKVAFSSLSFWDKLSKVAFSSVWALLRWPFPFPRFGYFRCPKRKSKTTFTDPIYPQFVRNRFLPL